MLSPILTGTLFLVSAGFAGLYMRRKNKDWSLSFYVKSLLIMFFLIGFSWFRVSIGRFDLQIPIGIPIFILFYQNNRERLSNMYFSKTNLLNSIIMGCAIGILSAAIDVLLVDRVNFENVFDMSSLTFLVKAIEVAVGEEFFFRSNLLNSLNRCGIKMRTANLIQCILFVVAHLDKSIEEIMMVGLFGILIGFIVYKYKNIYGAIAGHTLANIIPKFL